MPTFLKEHIPPDQMHEAEVREHTERTLRENLSTIVDPGDDPTARAGDVIITVGEADDGGVWVLASIDGDPTEQPPASDEADGRVFAELEV